MHQLHSTFPFLFLYLIRKCQIYLIWEFLHEIYSYKPVFLQNNPTFILKLNNPQHCVYSETFYRTRIYLDTIYYYKSEYIVFADGRN